MRSSWSPTLIPKDVDDQNVYLVLDDFGPAGRAFREVAVDATDLEAVIGDLIAGQFSDPISVFAFNTTEHWADDVSADVAQDDGAYESDYAAGCFMISNAKIGGAASWRSTQSANTHA